MFLYQASFFFLKPFWKPVVFLFLWFANYLALDINCLMQTGEKKPHRSVACCIPNLASSFRRRGKYSAFRNGQNILEKMLCINSPVNCISEASSLESHLSWHLQAGLNYFQKSCEIHLSLVKVKSSTCTELTEIHSRAAVPIAAVKSTGNRLLFTSRIY